MSIEVDDPELLFLVTAAVLLILKIRCTGIRSSVVVKENMRPSHWLESVSESECYSVLSSAVVVADSRLFI